MRPSSGPLDPERASVVCRAIAKVASNNSSHSAHLEHQDQPGAEGTGVLKKMVQRQAEIHRSKRSAGGPEPEQTAIVSEQRFEGLALEGATSPQHTQHAVHGVGHTNEQWVSADCATHVSRARLGMEPWERELRTDVPAGVTRRPDVESPNRVASDQTGYIWDVKTMRSYGRMPCVP
uniref:Uncharacterized protein n=1 Tax=Anopheles farauti TaxID=69004 RepID=A0A182QK57_9DIPT